MKGVLTLHLWNPPPRFHTLSLPSLSSPLALSVSASSSGTQQQDLLTPKERRRLRNERRESKNTTNWREEVEDKLSKKTKKEKKSWMDELNLDNLMKLGPQWWVVRVSRLKAEYTAEALARSLAKFFPDTDFKVGVVFSVLKMFCFVMDKNRNGLVLWFVFGNFCVCSPCVCLNEALNIYVDKGFGGMR